MTGFLSLEEQIVQNEAEIGFAGTVIGQTLRIGQERLDELVKVINLLQFSPRILIELAITRQDVEFLEQFDGLPGANFRNLGRGILLFHMPAIISFIFLSLSCQPNCRRVVIRLMVIQHRTDNGVING